MDAEMFGRLRTAALRDENPIVKFLTDSGAWAQRNRNVSLQRKHGDVLFNLADGARRSIESQVSEKYTNFSYNVSKVEEYVGPGKYEHAYVLLGCKQKAGQDGMFFLIVQAQELHRFIKENAEDWPPDEDYVKIQPGELQDLPGPIGWGNSREEALKRFLPCLSTNQVTS